MNTQQPAPQAACARIPRRGATALYDVRVSRRNAPAVEYTAVAASSIDAINAALDRFGNDARVSAKLAF